MDKYTGKSTEGILNIIEIELAHTEETTEALYVSANHLLEDVRRKVQYGLPPVERELGVPGDWE